MRLQSPASSGLLPASYSRRRRTRPNESIHDGSSMGGRGDGITANHSNYRDEEHSSNDYDDESTRDIPNNGSKRSNAIRRSNSGSLHHRSPSKKPFHTLALSSPSSDSENDENDERRANGMTMSSSSSDPHEKEDALPKPPKLSDFLMNDGCYQRYLTEGKRGKARYRGIRGGSGNGGGGGGGSSENNGIFGPLFLPKLCAGASFVGMLFLIFVAVLIETQPLYIKGVSVKRSNGGEESYKFRKETSNALKAAAAYFLTMVLSIIYIQVKDINLDMNPNVARICHFRRIVSSAYFRYRRRHYEDIPDNHHVTRSRSFGGVPGTVLPLHHTHGEDRMMKSRRRVKKNAPGGSGGSGGGSGSAIAGVLEKIRGWGIGGSSSVTGRKKDR